jgi:hypothetical protein
MQKAFLDLDETGVYVTAVWWGYEPPDNTAMMSPDQVNPGRFAGHHLVDGELVPRPQSPVPIETVDGWVISDCPEGTVVMVLDLVGSETMLRHVTGPDEPSVSIALPDTGQYEIEVVAPLPALPVSLSVEVS